jgi:hypothetical protein
MRNAGSEEECLNQEFLNHLYGHVLALSTVFKVTCEFAIGMSVYKPGVQVFQTFNDSNNILIS